MRPAWVPAPALQNQIEHAAGIEPAWPAWKAGAYADRPRVRVSRGRESDPRITELQPVAFPFGDLDERERADSGIGSPPHTRDRLTHCRQPRNRTPLAGFGNQRDPRSPPMSLGGRTRTCIGRAPDAVVSSLTHTQSNGVTVRYRSGTLAFTARCAEPLHHGHHQSIAGTQVVLCPRLESNQRLLRFGQAPSPDWLQGHRCGRGGARPRASSTIRLSKSAFVAQRLRSGTRTRTSTNRVKACWPAISRSPIGRGPRFVWQCGSERTRACDGRMAQTGLQPVSFAARMHAPPTRSRNSFPIA